MAISFGHEQRVYAEFVEFIFSFEKVENWKKKKFESSLPRCKIVFA